MSHVKYTETISSTAVSIWLVKNLIFNFILMANKYSKMGFEITFQLSVSDSFIDLSKRDQSYSIFTKYLEFMTLKFSKNSWYLQCKYFYEVMQIREKLNWKRFVFKTWLLDLFYSEKKQISSKKIKYFYFGRKIIHGNKF